MAFYRNQKLIEQEKNRNQKIIQLYESGLTQTEVGAKFGITQSAIYFILKKNNILCKKNITGDKNPNWKGGVMYDRGRKLIYLPYHPNPDRLNYCYEYKLIMEKYLGRYLKNDEVVHHIDGDITNNNIKNLQVMTQSEHINLHIKQGDMKRNYPNKYNFSYKNKKEYQKLYNKMYRNKKEVIENV